jgi:hypothetical protein
MRVYPFTSSQLLTDDIYISYGGLTGTTSAVQRNAAYFIAEEQVSQEVNAPIAPATITGTYFYPHVGGVVQLDWMRLQEINEIRFLDGKGYNYHTITGIDNYYAAIRYQERSVIDIFSIYANCSGCGYTYSPYQFQIVYRAGLPASISNSPNVLLALQQAAEIIINEIQGYGNEGVGGVGIEAFKNQDYFEKREPMLRTAFGNSAKAQFIKQLLAGVKVHKGIGF